MVTPEVIEADYEYRLDTDVITAVTVSGGQSDPDNSVTVTFSIPVSYTHLDVYKRQEQPHGTNPWQCVVPDSAQQ